MLVFTRKCNEAIIIGEGVEVRVLRTGPGGVRLGIVAPPEVSVHRQEVYEAIRAANERAAAGSGSPASWIDLLRRRLAGRQQPQTRRRRP